jgi:hypothetical protein
MHYIISVAMRITLATLILLGVCLFLMLELSSLIRELFADEHHQAPARADDDSRPRGSLVLEVSLQPERR